MACFISLICVPGIFNGVCQGKTHIICNLSPDDTGQAPLAKLVSCSSWTYPSTHSLSVYPFCLSLGVPECSLSLSIFLGPQGNLTYGTVNISEWRESEVKMKPFSCQLDGDRIYMIAEGGYVKPGEATGDRNMGPCRLALPYQVVLVRECLKFPLGSKPTPPTRDRLGIFLSPRGRGGSQAPVHVFAFLLFPGSFTIVL